MDDHIAPAGWTEMWYTGRDGNPRTMLQPEEVRFATFGSRGPGRASFARGARLTAQQARRVRRDAALSLNGG
jgi:pectinesterase